MSFDKRSPAMDGGSTAGSSSTATDLQAAVVLCKIGCGFYANAAFDGMCSKCYKDQVVEQQQQQQQQMTCSANNNNNSTNSHSSPAAVSSTAAMSSTISGAVSDNVLSDDTMSQPPVSDDTAVTSPCNTSTEQPPHNLETGSPTVMSAKCDVVRANVETEPSSGGPAVTELGGGDVSGGEKDKTKRNRCLTCKKRVGLTGFECRCGGLFCSLHRYSDMHACAFNYRELAQEQIRKNNPVVAGEKVKKI